MTTMNKNEFELQMRRLAVNARNYEHIANFAEHVVSGVTVLGAVYLFIDGLKMIALAQPEAITALATVVDKLQINAIMGYIVGGLCGAGWVYERRGKKRAISQYGELRRKIESNDPYHASSGLDANGHTPR